MVVYESDRIDSASLNFEEIIAGMKRYTVEQISEALKAAGSRGIKTGRHSSKLWITVPAKK